MTSHPQPIPLDGLSKRELEIVRLAAEGLSDRDIAERLVMSVNTIKWYNRQIYSKLGVGSRTQAIARVGALGLLQREADARPASSALFTLASNNLPIEATRLIGRERETTEIKRLLESARLLTLTGAPGTGKTRLSTHVAQEMTGAFPGGVYFVSLAPLMDPAHLVHTIARAIGANETPGQPMLATLKAALRDRQALLVLDNFEHLLPAAPMVSELLAATTQLRVLATSREALRLYGEQEYAVPLLKVPDPQPADLATLAACESIALFVERAQAVRPDFELTHANVLDIAEICIRLEGLPLAIELAAARVKLMRPKALLARLNRQLETLVGGPRDVPLRQQTLRQTIQWSFELLTVEEKTLLAQLAVFRGGRSLEAIEAVCRPGLALAPLEGTESLLNKSLLFLQRHQPGQDLEPRFLMLEAIREYALTELERSGEAVPVRRRHAEFFAALAERAAPEFTGPRQNEWFSCMMLELGNVRAALAWSRDHDRPVGLRLASALLGFWEVRGLAREGQQWLRDLLNHHPPPLPAAVRATALVAAANLTWKVGEAALARDLAREGRRLFLQLEDAPGVALALCEIGMAELYLSQFAAAKTRFDEALALARAEADNLIQARALNHLGYVSLRLGDPAGASAYFEASLALYQARGDLRNSAGLLLNLGINAYEAGDLPTALKHSQAALPVGREQENVFLVSLCLLNLGNTFIAQGNPAAARPYLEEGVALARRSGDLGSLMPMLGTLGRALHKLGQLSAARQLHAEALQLRVQAGERRGIAVTLENLGRLDQTEGRPERAVRLLAAAGALRAVIKTPMIASARVEQEAALDAARAALGDEALQAAWVAGQALTVDEAVALALR